MFSKLLDNKFSPGSHLQQFVMKFGLYRSLKPYFNYIWSNYWFQHVWLFKAFFYVFNSFWRKTRSASWISTPPLKYHNTMPTNIFEKFYHRLGLFSCFMAAFVILNESHMAMFNNVHFPKCKIKNTLLAHFFNKLSWNLMYIGHLSLILIIFGRIIDYKMYWLL